MFWCEHLKPTCVFYALTFQRTRDWGRNSTENHRGIYTSGRRGVLVSHSKIPTTDKLLDAGCLDFHVISCYFHLHLNKSRYVFSSDEDKFKQSSKLLTNWGLYWRTQGTQKRTLTQIRRYSATSGLDAVLKDQLFLRGWQPRSVTFRTDAIHDLFMTCTTGACC